MIHDQHFDFFVLMIFDMFLFFITLYNFREFVYMFVYMFAIGSFPPKPFWTKVIT